MMVFLILMAYVSLCVAVCFYRRLMSVVAMAGLCSAIYLLFFSHQIGSGLVVLVLSSFLSVLLSIANGEIEKEERRTKSYSKTSGSPGNWIFYAVPIFWPFLIGRAILCGKTRPTDMTPYDYEQHLKCNAR